MKKIYLLISLITITITITAQNIGIGTNTPTAQLHTTGTVRHAALNGVGIRPVFVDSIGNLLVNFPTPPASSAINNTAQSIPDISCTGITSTNSLADLPLVQGSRMTITINVTHPRLADLSIYLISPAGVIVNLLSPSAALVGANLTNTVFTDQGALLSSGADSYTGQFKPYGELTPSICGITPTVASFGAIAGGGLLNANGTWTLKVIDNTTGNTGTLNNWTIAVISRIGIEGVWGLRGNSGTNPFNFIGTTDKAPLRFGVNNYPAGLMDTAYNVFLGLYSGSEDNTGTGNVGIGGATLIYNTTGLYNTVVGTGGSLLNITGSYNTAVGSEVMFYNNSGSWNTATGRHALFSNDTGDFNSAFGDSALFYNQNGMNNVAIGANALFSSKGSNNIAIGRNADVTGTFNNAIAIGYNATVNASNKIRLGNTAISVIEGQVAFSFPSDGRFKTNITETVKGLEFITRLRPVVYNFQTKKYTEFLRKGVPDKAMYASQDFSESESLRQSGFVAQEVEKAAKEAGYDFNGIIAPKNDRETYGLAYSQFVVPLVKAVQEQQQQINELRKTNTSLVEENKKATGTNEQLQQQIQSLMADLNSLNKKVELIASQSNTANTAGLKGKK